MRTSKRNENSKIDELLVATHEILFVIICKEVLEAAGPVDATGQQPKHALLAAHVAVPRVLFDGRMCRPWTDEKVDTFHTETPAGERLTMSPSTLPNDR